MPLLLLALIGCGSPKKRIDSFVEAGWHDQACLEAGEDAALLAPIQQDLLAQLDLTLAMEPVPIEAFGLPPRGYAEEWWLVGIGTRRAPDVADQVTVKIRFDTWRPCGECTGSWMVAQMAAPSISEPKPTIETTVHKGTGLFDGIGQAFGAIARVTLGVALLPMVAFTEGVMMLPAQLADKNDSMRPFGLTKMVFDVIAGQPMSSGGTPSSAVTNVSVVQASSTGLTCTGDLPCTSSLVFRGDRSVPTTATVEVVARRGLCEARETIRIPIEAGDVPGAFTAAFPSEGRTLELGAP